tara:strand:- start:5083 stop:5436 length:354 start_codon:yes stop_codon:yes gene_type:complete
MSQTPRLLTIQQRLILDHLRHCRGGPLSVERLIVAIYGCRHDGGPDNPMATVRYQICQIRKRLRPYGVRLLSVGVGRGCQGYLIDPEDLDTLEDLLARTPHMDIDLARAQDERTQDR